VANASPDNAYPRFIGGTTESAAAERGPHAVKLEKGLVFTVPGQGSYARWALHELYGDDPETRALLERAGETTQLLLGQSILPLVNAASDSEHDALVARALRPSSLEVAVDLFREASDFPQLLASHFVRPFAFPDAVRRIR